MDDSLVGSIVWVAIIILAIYLYLKRNAGKTPDELNEGLYGSRSGVIVCPHCTFKGQVHTKSINKKVGISGGKATAALLTGGVSLLVTGLAKKEALTEAHCCHCKSTWHF